MKYCFRRCLLAGLILSAAAASSAQTPLDFSTFLSPHTTQEQRLAFRQDLLENTINKNLQKPLTPENEASWMGAFWAMELALHKSALTLQALKHALTNYSARSDAFQRAALEAAYTLYPTELRAAINDFAQHTEHPKLFAMAVHYLSRASAKNKNRHFLGLLQKKFPDWRINPILLCLHEDLENTAGARWSKRPPLVDLLTQRFGDGVTVIYSFQRHDRNFPGLTVVQKPHGKFARLENGNLFAISHLARAISNLPDYLTNGNSPQGILSIQNIYQSENVFIGRTPALNMFLPVEGSVQKFFHDPAAADTIWKKEMYARLLPASWKNYAPIYRAYHAGAAGRSEIVAHGTTIDPDFYVGQPYFPNTPSLGCLTAKEIWSPVDGTCLVSDQAALVNAYLGAGGKTGYLVLVEIDDQKRPVVLDDILFDLLQAEARVSAVAR